MSLSRDPGAGNDNVNNIIDDTYLFLSCFVIMGYIFLNGPLAVSSLLEAMLF